MCFRTIGTRGGLILLLGVAAGAISSRPNDPSVVLLTELNAFRTQIGLPHFRIDPRLSESALGHSRYLAENGKQGHRQDSSAKSYMGANALERAKKMGFDGRSIAQVIAYTGPERAIRGLIDAPYHRILLCAPGDVAIGIGWGESNVVIDLAVQPQSSVTLYPADGQIGVPVQWRDVEIPDPLRLHGLTRPVGTVLSVAFFGMTVHDGRGTLTSETGENVPIAVNTPQNDDLLQNGIFLIPRSPLLPLTRYTARVNATLDNGRTVERTWSFTTGGILGPHALREGVPPAPAPIRFDQIVTPQADGSWKVTVEVMNVGTETIASISGRLDAGGNPVAQASTDALAPGATVLITMTSRVKPTEIAVGTPEKRWRRKL